MPRIPTCRSRRARMIQAISQGMGPPYAHKRQGRLRTLRRTPEAPHERCISAMRSWHRVDPRATRHCIPKRARHAGSGSRTGGGASRPPSLHHCPAHSPSRRPRVVPPGLADRDLDADRESHSLQTTRLAAHLRAQLAENVRIPPRQSSCGQRTPANVRVDDLTSPYDSPSMHLTRAT